MPEFKQFKLPDVGEGLTDGEIVRWLVQPGDAVVVNQPIVEVETAKAAVELPCPYQGVVTELHAAEGSTVDVGTPIITVDVDPDGAVPASMPDVQVPPPGGPPETPVALRDDLTPAIPRPADDEAVEPGLIGGPAPGGRTSVLVGYGPKSVTAKRRPRKAAGAPANGDNGGAGVGPRLGVLAKPPVRKLARDLGVDLAALAGSGPDGVVTRSDVETAAAAPAGAQPDPSLPTAPALSVAAPAAGARPAAVWDASREQRIPVHGVRKRTAAAMVASAFTAPHVTEFLTIDITATMELRTQVAALPEFAAVKVSPLLFVARAVLLAARRHPMVNSSWDEGAQEIVVKQYVNLGIAAATDRGLVVPNVKDAGRLSLLELAVALNELTETARAGRTTPAGMTGGTITVTNVGVFGVDTGTPILNPGESAILAFGAVRDSPWVVDGQLAVRKVTQLALSFDHRVLDGQLGSEFLADVGAVLAEPVRALGWT